MEKIVGGGEKSRWMDMNIIGGMKVCYDFIQYTCGDKREREISSGLTCRSFVLNPRTSLRELKLGGS